MMDMNNTNSDLVEEVVNEFQKNSHMGSYKETDFYKNNRKAILRDYKFKKKLNKLTKKNIGFTNKLAVSIMVLLATGLVMGFILAWKSIDMQYTGPLMCYTAVFTPIGTACSIVLARVVEKNRSENTAADGTGITFAAAQAANFKTDTDELFDNSPCI